MRFRPCIDIHNGKVKQIVGGSLRDEQDRAAENFVSDRNGAWYAGKYGEKGLTGGHIVLLNPVSSPYYEEDLMQAFGALEQAPGVWQIGGGITPETAPRFLAAGASHVIVTSWLFEEGKLSRKRLDAMREAAGTEHLVIDLSCRRRGESYVVVTDRWQTFTGTQVTLSLLEELGESCSEFLVHGVDSEGKAQGPETDLVELLGGWDGCPVTYAGGIRSLADIRQIASAGKGRVDVTVGSALDLFGGDLPLDEICAFIENLPKN